MSVIVRVSTSMSVGVSGCEYKWGESEHIREMMRIHVNG